MAKRIKAPSTARLHGILANAAEILIVEAGPDELDRADAARIVVTGDEIAGLARVLAVVDGGTGGPTNCSVEELFWMAEPLVSLTHGRGMFRIDLSAA